VIYLDTSVALAHLFAEDLQPPDEIWHEPLVSSRLLEYELWVAINARKLGGTHADVARDLLDVIAIVELSTAVLSRVVQPFPVPIRTLDALHLASLAFLEQQGHAVELLSYDRRMLDGARAMKLGISTFSAGSRPLTPRG
jgi:hypothetical protein